MRNVIKAVVIVLVTMAVISLVLTFVFPSHSGEVRQDLHEGDYIIHEGKLLDSKTVLIKQYIVGFDQYGNVIVSDSLDDRNGTSVMTKEEFLGILLFKYNRDDCKCLGYSKLDTPFGNKLCVIYENNDSTYWVGEHDIIYKYSFHGITGELTETSLIIA